jgi:hypothetical protein
VTLIATAAVGVAFVVATVLVAPTIRRTQLGIWHPAAAWLALEALFFGVGSAILAATEGRPAPALFVAGSVLAFSAGVAISGRIAQPESPETTPKPTRTKGAQDVPPGGATLGEHVNERVGVDLRWPLIWAIVGVALVILVPTLLMVGIPALASDVTGARTAIGGLEVQFLRVAVPAALVAGAVIASTSVSTRIRVAMGTAIAIAIAAEIALASRYLAAELVSAIVIGLALAGRQLLGRRLALVFVVGGLVFVVVGVLRAYGEAAGDPLGFALDRSVNRILLIEPRTLDAIQAAIPGDVPYFGGLTWVRRLAPLLGRDDVPNLGYWIYARLFPGQSLAGYAAPGVLGEAWANFGPVGIVVPAVFGVIAERLGAAVATHRRSAADVAAGALAILFLARTHAVGVDGLIVLAVIVAAWRLIAAPVTVVRLDRLRPVRSQS